MTAAGLDGACTPCIAPGFSCAPCVTSAGPSLGVPPPLCPGYAVTTALDLAKKDNVTWLIHLDPDELLHPGASHAAGVLAGSYSLLPELCSTPRHVPSVR